VNRLRWHSSVFRLSDSWPDSLKDAVRRPLFAIAFALDSDESFQERFQRGSAVTFALPVLAEWFAAEALRFGEVDIPTLATDPRRLALWHYPLAIAAGTFGHEEVARIMDPAARPGLQLPCRRGRARWLGRSDAGPPPAQANFREDALYTVECIKTEPCSPMTLCVPWPVLELS
jgi:hypothetical protein